MIKSLNVSRLITAVVGIPPVFVLLVLVLALFSSLSNKWLFVILAGFTFVVVAIMTRDIKCCLLFLLIMGMPLNLDVSLISRDYRGSINSIYISLTDIATFGLIGLWAVESLSNRGDKDRKINLFPKITYPLLLLLGASLLSLAVTSDNTWSVYGIVYLIKLNILYFVVANTVRTKEEIKYVMSFLVLSLFIQSLMYLVQSYGKIDFNIMGESLVSAYYHSYTRPRGFMGTSNTAGVFFAASLVLTLSWYCLQLRSLTRLLTLIVVFVGASALILSFCRAGWSSATLCGFIFVIVGIKRGWMSPQILLVLLVASIVILVIFWNPIVARITGPDAGSAESRITLMKLAMNIIKDHPFLGVGINAYIDAMHRHITPEFENVWLDKVHNQYLLVWAETGIVGFLSFLWFLGAVLKEGIKSMRSKNAVESILAAGMVLSFLAICLSMLTTLAIMGTVTILTWFLAGLIVALANSQASSVSAKKSI